MQQQLNEILRALGRIEGELIEIRKLSERVRALEVWRVWLPCWTNRRGFDRTSCEIVWRMEDQGCRKS